MMWKRDYLRMEFRKVCLAIEVKEAQQHQPTDLDGEKNALILHLEFYPQEVKKWRLHELYQEHCGELFNEVLGINQLIITYSRPKNLGDYITQAKLHQADGKSASTIMGEFKQGLTL